jgi:2-methylcitrate dehydratase PrpD
VTVVLQDAFTELVKTEGEVGPHNATASMEFCLAAMMREKHVGVSEFTDDYINDTRTRELMEKVDIDFVPDLFGKGYGEFGARLVVQTTAGDEYVEEEPVALGGPENPMTEEHFDKKYLECATSAISIDDARSLARKLDDLERHNTLEEFVRILQ